MIWWTSSTTPGMVWCSCTHAVDAEAPHGRAAERRQQHATHRVAERVAEAALERLEAELGDVRIVLALGRFDQLRTDEPRRSIVVAMYVSCDGHSGMLPGNALPRP